MNNKHMENSINDQILQVNNKADSLVVNYENKPAYSILLEPSFGRLAEAIQSLGMSNRRFMIVSDSNVSKYYLEEIKELLLPIAKMVGSYTFPAGESSKNLNTVNGCYGQMILSSFDRKDVLIALGGGVVGDLTGFAAATYLRGIRFIQLPTSLLSMVDSSIGGKTGVDYKTYKNIIGAFHQPKLVYMNIATLNSLHNTEFYSGMGEIIKHGLIKDLEYYRWLKVNSKGIKSKQYDLLSEMIYRSCQIKRAVVELDPKELGERALLNYGHTIGHSIEKLKNFTLLHGECVSIGMAAATYISMNRGYIDRSSYRDILQTLCEYEQPISAYPLSAEEIYEVTKLDKKMDSGQIRFILLKDIGSAYIDTTVSKEEMMEGIQSVLVK